MGFGVSKAAAEAQALAEALSKHDDVDIALAAYNDARQPLCERILLHGRKLGTQLGVGIETDEDRTLSKLLQDPKLQLLQPAFECRPPRRIKADVRVPQRLANDLKVRSRNAGSPARWAFTRRMIQAAFEMLDQARE
jgi:hypothetical protein